MTAAPEGLTATSPELPAAFVRAVTDVHGEAGARWLRRLPQLRDECARRWRVRLGFAYPLTYHYVVTGERADGMRCVLKLGPPGAALAREAAALRWFDGHGAVRLLDADLPRGALLLERAEPGVALTSLVADDDRAATTVAAGVVRALWRPAGEPPPLPDVGDLAGAFTRYRSAYRDGGPLPADLVDHAGDVFAELVATTTTRVVLHGDLHHDNVLSASRGWLAVDPAGVAGDPAYDTASLLHNPMRLRTGGVGALVTRRTGQLADELHLDRARVTAWGFTKAVLSELWSVETTARCTATRWPSPRRCVSSFPDPAQPRGSAQRQLTKRIVNG